MLCHNNYISLSDTKGLSKNFRHIIGRPTHNPYSTIKFLQNISECFSRFVRKFLQKQRFVTRFTALMCFFDACGTRSATACTSIPHTPVPSPGKTILLTFHLYQGCVNRRPYVLFDSTYAYARIFAQTSHICHFAAKNFVVNFTF
jgi:hypothetical protein